MEEPLPVIESYYGGSPGFLSAPTENEINEKYLLEKISTQSQGEWIQEINQGRPN